jgi:4-aminobutyrate aminotransferase-like enzyme
VCSAGGRAVLRVVDRERLQEHCGQVGWVGSVPASQPARPLPPQSSSAHCSVAVPLLTTALPTFMLRARLDSLPFTGAGGRLLAGLNLCFLTTRVLSSLSAGSLPFGPPVSTAQVGDYLLGRLRALQLRHAVLGDVRGTGLMLGVELVKDRATKVRCV